MIENLRDKIFKIHDIECNQKYGDNLPYSFHLKCVEAQYSKFKHLLPIDYALNNNTNVDVFKVAVWAHDLIEDGRMTYNDIVTLVKREGVRAAYCDLIADIVYCVTDEKGRNRGERKNDKYYSKLKENKYAVFVKLCDISANTIYSKLTGSSMYEKYKKEFPLLKEKLYIEEYKELFDYVENL